MEQVPYSENVDPWLLHKHSQLNRLMVKMIKAEELWIQSVGTVIDKRIVVADRPEVEAPEKLIRATNRYLKALKKEAKKQGKKSSVGDRRCAELGFLTRDGLKLFPHRWQGPPIWKITKKVNEAFRGRKLEPDVAIQKIILKLGDLMKKGRISPEGSQAILQNSIPRLIKFATTSQQMFAQEVSGYSAIYNFFPKETPNTFERPYKGSSGRFIIIYSEEKDLKITPTEQRYRKKKKLMTVLNFAFFVKEA